MDYALVLNSSRMYFELTHWLLIETYWPQIS